jgi:ureidoacrylate peracid hydrolase
MALVMSGNLDPGNRLREGAAVLVIDVQNDFCHEDGGLSKLGAYELELIQPMVPKLSAFVDAARAAGIPVVWVKTEYDDATTSSRWSRRRGGEEVRICRPGTWGAEWYGLDPAEDEIVVVKHRYSPFVNAPLETVLRAQGFETLLLTGVTTNVCVESTARDAFMRDYQVVVVSDCVAASDSATNEASLQNIRRHFGAVLSSQDIESIWAGQGA